MPRYRLATPRLEVHPNPFRTTATLRVVGTPDSTGVLRIYTPAGRLVRVLEHRGTLAWDGTDPAGLPLAVGTYFALLGRSQSRISLQAKMTRLH